MARAQPITMLIYEEEKRFIEELTLKYPNIETGGDLFGLWRNESEVIVTLVTGPGRDCRRTTTAFFQDRHYLSDVGNYLTSVKGLCNIGEWHSHHSLNLPEPSGGDRSTVWRNMPGSGLKRFLLIIATIKPQNRRAEMNGFMFTAPPDRSRPGGMYNVESRSLPGPNPYRKQPEVEAKLNEGAETRYSGIEEVYDKGQRKREKEARKKEEKKAERIQNYREKADKEKNYKKNRSKESEILLPKHSRKGLLQRFRKKRKSKNHHQLADIGGTPGFFFQNNPSGGGLPAHETSPYNTNNVARYEGSYNTPEYRETQERNYEHGGVGYYQPHSPAGRSCNSEWYSKSTMV